MSKWTRAEILIVRQCAGTMKVANIGRQEGISMKTDTDGLTMNQLAERNAALTAKLSMINDLMEVAEQANKLAQEAAEKLVQERNALAAENARMTSLDIAIQGGALDGFAVQELALKHGLLRKEEYCAERHRDMVYAADLKDGDDVYFRVENPATDAFLAEVRAQGVEMFGSTTIQFGEEEGDEDIIYAGNQALLFAAQLRREAAQ
ncbi:hypothetical protein ACVRBC_001970 [Salmonella enterica subsp. enterica serovar Newport]